MLEAGDNSISFGAHTYRLDGFGFLDPPEQWDEAFADGMARMLGVFEGLTDEHWRLVRYLRRRFVEEQVVPVVVFACRDNQLTLNRLRALFPTGYHRGACKIAGISHEFMRAHNLLLSYENYTTLRSEHLVTEDGFLADFAAWNKRFARLVASEWDLAEGLGDQHWRVIGYLRDCFEQRGRVPSVIETCSANELSLEQLYELFPDGYRRGACRMAGLPFRC